MIDIVNPITGSGGKGGSGGGASKEDPNTLQSDMTARVIDLISEGPIGGLANGSQSIYFDSTPLQDAAGNNNFLGVTWDERDGFPDQDYISGFSEAENSYSVNVQVMAGTPVIRTIAGPVDAVRLTIRIPTLTYQDPNNGDLHGSQIRLLLSTRPSGTGAWTIVDRVQITGKKVSEFDTSVRVELGGSNDWDIMVTRVTADSTTVNLQNQTWWLSNTVITDGKFKYPNSAYFGLTVDAQQFGSSIPTRAYDVYGLCIQVPQNYDPVARTYTGMWDGTFQTAWTDNPAWVLYDILTNSRYGIGGYISAAQVDKWSFYAIAQYCDQLVPDGFGGTEPRYTFNYQIASRADAYKIIQAIASSFRGLTFWASGMVYAFADMPADPVKMVTAANVKDGLFTYEGTALSARHSVVMVTWFDPNDSCRPAIELVEDHDLIALYGWRALDFTAYGCTSRGQAHRMGKWALDTEKNATQTVNYEAAWDHIDVAPGEIIEVFDVDYAGLRMAGRLTAATTMSITIDAPISIQSGKSYTLQTVIPDGTMASRPLTNSAGSASVLTFTTALPSLPVIGALWGVTSSDLAPRQFRVVSVKEGNDNFYTVTALFHDPTKYARIEQNIKLDPIPYTRYTNSCPDAVISLTVKEYLYRYGVDIRSAATLTWMPSANPTILAQQYEIQRRRANGNWEELGTTSVVSFDVLNAESGNWSFRVRAIGFNGLASDWLQKDVVLFGLQSPPGDVQNFALHILGANATLSWDANTDIDLDHYYIKYAPITTGASWSSATDLIVQATGTSVQTVAMNGTYLIKAISQFGIESDNAAAIVTTISGVNGLNEVAVVSDWPAWSGTQVGTAVVGGILQLQPSDTLASWPHLSALPELSYGSAGLLSSGIYTFQNAFDLGAVFTSRLSAIVDASGDNITDTLATWPELANQGNLSGTDATAWSVQIQLCTTQTDPTASPVWSAWQNLVVGDYTARAFRFRLILNSDDVRVTPLVSYVAISIDMPDRTASANSVSVPSGGIAVTFNPAFRNTPAVGITGQNLTTGDTFQYISGPSASGFSGYWQNSSGTAVARVMDWIAKGYGYES